MRRRALEIRVRKYGQLVTTCARNSHGFGTVPTGDTGLYIHELFTGCFAKSYEHPWRIPLACYHLTWPFVILVKWKLLLQLFFIITEFIWNILGVKVIHKRLYPFPYTNAKLAKCTMFVLDVASLGSVFSETCGLQIKGEIRAEAL
jgi:hypothetical protein